MTGKDKHRKRDVAKTKPSKNTNEKNAPIVDDNNDVKNQLFNVDELKKDEPEIAANSEQPTKKGKRRTRKRQIMEENDVLQSNNENFEMAPQDEASSELHPPSKQLRRAKVDKKNSNEEKGKAKLPEDPSNANSPTPTEGNDTNPENEQKDKVEVVSKLHKNANKRGRKKKAHKSEDENHGNTAEVMKEDTSEMAPVIVIEETPEVAFGETKQPTKRARQNKNNEFKEKSTFSERKEPVAKTRKKLTKVNKNKEVQKPEHENADAPNEPTVTDEKEELAEVAFRETKQTTKRARQNKNNDEFQEKSTFAEDKEIVAKTSKKLTKTKKNNESQKPEHENACVPKVPIATNITEETPELTKPAKTRAIQKQVRKLIVRIPHNKEMGEVDVNTEKMTKQTQDPAIIDVSSDDDFEIEQPVAKKVNKPKATKKPSSSAPSSKEEKGPKPVNRSILQLKIVLRYITPPIYRRIQVLNNNTFYDLQNHINEAMGWISNHAHQFIVFNPKTDSNISIVDGDVRGLTYDFSDPHMLKEQTTKLSRFLSAKGDRLLYEFDLRDSWIHEIVVEKILPPPPPKAKYPKCTGGKRACPPEDCGGVDGYNHLVEVYKNPNHKEYEKLINDWLGEFNPGWDPEKFEKKKVFRTMRQ